MRKNTPTAPARSCESVIREPNILDKILEWKRVEVAQHKREQSPDAVRAWRQMRAMKGRLSAPSS